MFLRYHIPTIFHNVRAEKVEQFESLEELLELPFVKSFRMDPFDGKEPHKYFKQYSVSEYIFGNQILMVEYNKCEDWDIGYWVIGYLSKEAYSLDLPKWVPPQEIK